MNRICPDEAFMLAHNGLNVFLTEYPHMSQEQITKIRQLIEYFARPEYYRNKVRRPALTCQVRQDGAILITPNTVRTADSIVSP